MASYFEVGIKLEVIAGLIAFASEKCTTKSSGVFRKQRVLYFTCEKYVRNNLRVVGELNHTCIYGEQITEKQTKWESGFGESKLCHQLIIYQGQ